VKAAALSSRLLLSDIRAIVLSLTARILAKAWVKRNNALSPSGSTYHHPTTRSQEYGSTIVARTIVHTEHLKHLMLTWLRLGNRDALQLSIITNDP
jgi:hypothetical protein